jgi:hypothetical protein
MYIKLRTSGTNPYNILKILDWCINNRPATGSNIATQISTAGNATLAGFIDQTNTQVWNSGTGITALTANTVSKFNKSSGTTHTYNWFVEQQAYDNANYRHVTSIVDGSSATISATNAQMHHYSGIAGSLLTGITTEPITSNTYGTASTYGTGSAVTNHDTAVASPLNVYWWQTAQLSNSLTGATMFITDNCLVLFFTANTAVSFNNGVPAGVYATNGSFMRGIILTSQYTRADPWNTSTSGIPPFIYNGTNNVGGFGFMNSDSRFNSNQNVGFSTTSGTIHILADRVINNTTSNALSNFTYVSRCPANVGIGLNRFDDNLGLNQSNSSATTGALSTTSTHGAAVSSTAGSRFISADLKSQTYGLLPFTWACRYYNVSGGNITDRAGLYWFNGDFFPGDTLVSGTKTYVLLNGSLDQSMRIALAVPRE